MTLSYAHGASDIPLIGDTIGTHFDRTVSRWGDRPGVISRQQAVPAFSTIMLSKAISRSLEMSVPDSFCNHSVSMR